MSTNGLCQVITDEKTVKEDNYLYDEYNTTFPSTRYQGSKSKIVDWIWDNIKSLSFNTALDAFGGTGSVSYLLKSKSKSVTYNDILKFNHIIGKALIENSNVTLTNEDIEFILYKDSYIQYPTIIQDNFQDIFYLDEENIWLDTVITNINNMKDEYKQALAWFALFQSCIIKRPYNLFHRANLYVRTSDVERSFGNKTTWDKSFEEHFIHFVREANNAIFDSENVCTSINYDALDIEDINYDLVYIDTPYINNSGVGVDYFNFYHFLEGMVDYSNWENRISQKCKHHPLTNNQKNTWIDKKEIFNSFDSLIKKYRDSIIVISYRNDGIPSETQLLEIIKNYKRKVYEIKSKEYKYVLSNKTSKEILFIAE